MLDKTIIIAGVLLNAAGAALYVRDTLAGRTKPNLVTFILWAASPLIGAVAAFVQGVGWAAVPTLFTGLLPVSVVVAALLSKHGLWRLRPFDYVCGLFSVLALVLWAATKDANIAIGFAILSDLLAAVPTLRKSWTNPETETPLAYVASTISAASSFLVVADYSFAEIAFPSYLFIIGLTFLALFARRRISRAISTRAHF